MTKRELSNWALGVVIAGAVLALLSWVLWLDSWNRLSPEEKERVEQRKQTFYQDIDHCRRVTERSVVDFNNPEFRRCATLLQDLEDQRYEAAGSR